MSADSFSKSEKQPRSLLWHPSNFIAYIQQVLGVINYDIDYQHFFMSANLFHLLVRRVDVALKIGIIGKANESIGLKKKKSLNQIAMRRINQVWNGKVYLYMLRDRNYDIDDWKIVYEKIDQDTLTEREECMECPPLKSLDPNTLLKDKELGVRIRTTVPFKYAWWGHDYAQVVTAGKFHWRFVEGTKPMFESDEDILYSEAYTDVVSREYFHKMIDILTDEWRKWETYLFLELHKIIEDNVHAYRPSEEYEDFGLIS